MCKLFRRKKKVRIIKSKRLIDLQKIINLGKHDIYNIVIHPDLSNFHSTVEGILEVINQYSDKVYIDLYQEYHRNYSIYDRVPNLLLYQVFKAVSKLDYDHVYDSKIMYFMPGKDIYETLPMEFRLPLGTESKLRDMYSRLYTYLSQNRPTVDEYIDTIRFSYTQNWEAMSSLNSEAMKDYLHTCLNLILSFTPEENIQIVKNIIERVSEE